MTLQLRIKSLFRSTMAFLLLCVTATEAPGMTTGTGLEKIDMDFSAYSVHISDIEGDQRSEIVAGAFDHHIYVLNSDGKKKWSLNVGGLPFALASADLDKDGNKEIIAIVHKSPPSVMAINYKKRILWTVTAQLPFLSVAAGDFDADGNAEIAVGAFMGQVVILDQNGKVKSNRVFSKESRISALALGNLDKMPGDELVVGTSRNGIYALNKTGKIIWRSKAKFEGDQSKRGSRKDAKKRKTGLHPRQRTEKIQSLMITDLNQDGTNEVVAGSRPYGQVTVMDAAGRVLWQKGFSEIVGKTSAAKVTVGNFNSQAQRHLICILNGVITGARRSTSPVIFLDANGNVLGKGFPQSLYFSLDAGDFNRDGLDDVILSSSARGRGINVLSMKQGWQNSISEDKDDARLTIEPALHQMRSSSIMATADKPAKNFHFLYRVNYKDLYPMGRYKLDRFLQTFKTIPGENAVILTNLFENKGGARKKAKNKKLSSERITDIAGWFETHEIPFYLDIAKHAKLFFTLETLEKILARAPTRCKGFIIDENNFSRAQLWVKFLDQLDKILTMLSKFPGKKLIMNEYLGFWHRLPLEERIFKKLFQPRYREVLVPVYKPNNMKSPELNLGVLVGLWGSGTVGQWGAGIYGDMWKWGTDFFGTPGDVELRFATLAISMGANYFVFARNVLSDSKITLDLADGYKLYFDTLYHLIANNAITPLEDPSRSVFSSFAVQQGASPKEIAMRSSGTQIYWQAIYGLRNPLDTGFFLQKIRRNYLSQLFYPGMSNYYDGLFPKTPFGFVPIFPTSIQPHKVGNFHDYWIVDDATISNKDGQPLELEKILNLRRHPLQKHADRLPLTSADAFLACQKTEKGFKVYLINPYLFETRSVKARIQINHKGLNRQISDVITGKPIGTVKDDNLEIEIPAGLFRIIEFKYE